MDEIILYNSLGHEKQQFVSRGREVRMYSCGPTVYGRAHIGNLRSYVFADVLRRVLQYNGLVVRQVMNLTDVDDKTIRLAKTENKPLSVVTEPFIDQFKTDTAALHIESPTVLPRATDYIPQMVALIKELLRRKVAYQTEDGSSYFSIQRFAHYGRLTGTAARQLQTGASGRVSADEYDKEQVADFALWKAWTPEDGAVFWQTSLGKGRPGWHIECSAMAMAELSEAFVGQQFEPAHFQTLDIHTGGVDNAFPHHEDEIAQSEAVTGKPFSRFFMHGEHLLVDGQKMAKSLGNVYTLDDLAKHGAEALDFRFLLLQAHYRQKLNFTWMALAAAREARLSLAEFVSRQRQGTDDLPEALAYRLTETRREVEAALVDDLGTPMALAALLLFKREVNRTHLANQAVANLFDLFEPVFALGWQTLPEAQAALELPAEIAVLKSERDAVRAAKDWAKADALRLQLEQAGYSVRDEAAGSVVRPV